MWIRWKLLNLLSLKWYMNTDDEHDDLGVFVLNDHCEEIEELLRSLFYHLVF